MWPIFLKILSIIGIVLACILGVVIVLLLLILLCPVIYRIDGTAKDNKYTAKIRIKYLFGIVRAGYDYPEPGNIYAKAAWFTLYDSSKGNDDQDESKNLKSDASYEDTSEEGAEFEALDIDSYGNPIEKHETEESTKDSVSNSKSKKNKSNTSKTNNNKPHIINPMYYIKKAWENFRYKVIVKIQYLIKDIKYYYALWEHDDTQALFNSVKKRGLKMLKIIAPKKGKVDLIFGADSPDTTGKIYGICCALFTKWPKTFNIVPDFENKIIEGSLYIKGYFNLFSLAVHALPIILSKKLRLTKARLDAHGDKKDISKAKNEKKHEKILKDLEEEYS